MTNLPLPVRLAAGLAVTAVEQARRLPEQLAGLPVTVVSQALSLSMRVQQQVTELAIKGDEALSGLQPPEENPEWATFDEDLPGDDVADDVSAADRRSTASASEDGRAGGSGADDGDDADLGAAGPAEITLRDPVLGDAPAARGRASAGRRSAERRPAAAEPTAAGPAADRGSAGGPRGTEADTRGQAVLASDDVEAPSGDSTPARFVGAVVPEEDSAHPSDAPVTGYDAFSLAQLRGRLRSLSPEQLRALLSYERAGRARPAYVRMLSNRLVTVGAE
ncbi:hypothetical protein FHR81_002859 [Actinoalloteichus hoggarensis]|uniref:Uncharacterized protein n=1 Tax=Actinoalloteichus hoggarensis TaxID=1470176 RepID=A0A221VY25_9PSEU|nr:lipid droplet-associated protein [Actinoalloteichus hoggarensis]ASO18452.1 hypothetical protein AHOG_03980 [Actinoalloteichus hoggarensis]MBB5921819.1 hypothetical protein [Actinoalloteichus hoggarensis]